MKKNILIFGNGNHCKIVKQEIEKNSNYKIKAIFDIINNKVFLNEKFKRKKIDLNKKYLAITAIGNNIIRKKLVKIIERKFRNIIWAKIISKNAIINKEVKIGEGTLIVSGAVLNINSSIGSHSIVNTSCSLDHDVKVGDFTDLAPGVNIAGNVNIGNNVFVGIGSSIMQKIKIEDNVIIGGQSFVNKNCKSNSKYFGVPSKKIK